MKTAFVSFLILTLVLPGFAEPAQLDTIWPPGGMRGTEVEVTLTGKLEPWPVQLWFSGKGLTFTPDKEKKGTGKIKIAPEAENGPVVIQARNPEGVSSPVFFLIGDNREILESEEDKNTIAQAHPIEMTGLPLVINGKIPSNNELDSFRFSLKKEETLHAAVEGYTLRSLIDPVLQVYDAAGNRIAIEHDSPAHLDPRLAFTAPEAGDFVLAVMAFAHPPAASVYFRGDKKAQYRLHLSRKKEDLPARLFPESPGPDTAEPKLERGKSVTGTLGKPGEVDSIPITAKKGDSLFFQVEAQALGFPTDPVLRIRKPDGSELKTVDDANKVNDPEYLWKASEDGDFTVEIFDRFQRGGSTFRYRLSALEPKPDFTATIEKSEYVLEAGKNVDIKVTIVKTRGHKSDLTFEIPGLPPRVKLTAPDKVAEKGGDVVLKLEAEKETSAFQKDLTIHVFEKGEDGKKTGKPKVAAFSFNDDNYRGPYVMVKIPSIWLTIPPAREKEPAKEKEKK
ncbi:MAG: hypothetical protein P1U87_10040 [Verrucomicrobiales bacterium]|nr:hypothetical protein [Verrucomicrobiales bacterium]